MGRGMPLYCFPRWDGRLSTNTGHAFTASRTFSFYCMGGRVQTYAMRCPNLVQRYQMRARPNLRDPSISTNYPDHVRLSILLQEPVLFDLVL